MNRKETTKLLTEILIQERMADRKYYAKEVTLDYGAAHPKRVDVMQFLPRGTTSASDIEKGIFICYEIKSCVQDVYSGHGLNFYGEKNYVVCTMETYKKLMPDIREGKFDNFRKTESPESSKYYGFLVPIPKEIYLHDSDAMHENFMEPKKFGGEASDWKLWTAAYCREGRRNRPVTELLFCMLRSKHNYTNSFEEEIRNDRHYVNVDILRERMRLLQEHDGKYLLTHEVFNTIWNTPLADVRENVHGTSDLYEVEDGLH